MPSMIVSTPGEICISVLVSVHNLFALINTVAVDQATRQDASSSVFQHHINVFDNLKKRISGVFSKENKVARFSKSVGPRVLVFGLTPKKIDLIKTLFDSVLYSQSDQHLP